MGQHGEGCSLQCDCDNGAACDPLTGACQCPPGFRGPRCTEACPLGTWGANCTKSCDCLNEQACNQATGQCDCVGFQ